MRRGGTALEDSSSWDHLACLVLRVIAQLSPCTRESLIAFISEGDFALDQRCATPVSHERELLSIALLKLESLALIQVAEFQIAITEQGRQLLDKVPSVSLRPVRSCAGLLGAHIAPWAAIARLKLLNCFAEARVITQWTVEVGIPQVGGIVRKAWLGKVAPLVESSATALVYGMTDLAANWRTRAEAWIVFLRKRRRQSGSWLTTVVGANLRGRSQLVVFTGALLVVALAMPVSSYLGGLRNSGSPADAAEEPHTPAKEISPTTAVNTAAPSEAAREPADTATAGPANMEQHASDNESAPSSVEETATDPIVLSVRQKLAEPALRKGTEPRDLAALEAFYATNSGPPLWITGSGLNEKAQLVISEIKHTDDWGLSADAFDLPPPLDVPATTDTRANDEIKLGLAILKYARFARGGRLSPGRISDLLDQRPNPLDPKTILAGISVSNSPDAYLRSLHPKHEQFERLRQALLKVRARSAVGGSNPEDVREIQRLIVNMERWRWMPSTLGSYYVWDNIPEFTARVVKNGKIIYADKTIVGQPKYSTPIFSAEMRSIVFHPEWTVPETIIREDLQPALQHGGFFGGPSTAILEEHELKVSFEGRPVDANSVDWANANIWQYTFTQPPGPDNVLGTLKFNFPNKHAVYMHDTVQPELFSETERSLSHGCIRVHEPDRLAAVLLAEDKGWSAQQVKVLLAKDTTTMVPLDRHVPVHLTYFTAVVDENGAVQSFADIYGIDNKMGAALFGKRLKLDPPVDTDAQDSDQTPSWRSAERTGSLADAISGLFGN
jgi:L,D-transpeptidase YcbB